MGKPSAFVDVDEFLSSQSKSCMASLRLPTSTWPPGLLKVLPKRLEKMQLVTLTTDFFRIAASMFVERDSADSHGPRCSDGTLPQPEVSESLVIFIQFLQGIKFSCKLAPAEQSPIHLAPVIFQTVLYI